MDINDLYLIIGQYETVFVYGLLVVLLLCFMVIAICDLIEPRHSKYRESMGIQIANDVSKWNKTHPNEQIELRERKDGDETL